VTWLVVFIVLAVFAMIVINQAVVVVPANTTYVVERLGRYHQTLHPGLNVLAPFLDRVAFRYSLRPNEERLTHACITLDNIPVHVASSFRWEIIDPRAAAYNSADPAQFVVELMRSRQRQWISEHSFTDARETTHELRSAVLQAVAEPATQSGVRITEVNVEQIARHT
jgi:regulator of protease activity HflC (stomatin/prohibitin superfamily)